MPERISSYQRDKLPNDIKTGTELQVDVDGEISTGTLSGRRLSFVGTIEQRAKVRRRLSPRRDVFSRVVYGRRRTDSSFIAVNDTSDWRTVYTENTPYAEMTNAQRSWRVAKVGSVLLTAALVIGGTGDRMSDQNRNATALELANESLRDMSPLDQYEALYDSASSDGVEVARFDDTEDSEGPKKLFNSMIAKQFAELDMANVNIGTDCLTDTRVGYAYSIRYGDASYVRVADGVKITSRNGDSLLFGLNEGIITPADKQTKGTLEDLGCDTDTTIVSLDNKDVGAIQQ